MKKNKFFMLAVALIFALAGCDTGNGGGGDDEGGSGGGGGGTSTPNTFTVTGITSEMEAAGADTCLVGLFPEATTREQVMTDVTSYVADSPSEYCLAYLENPQPTGTANNKSISGSLLDPSGNAWHGAGTFHIWFLLYNGTTYVTYRTKTPVTLTDGGSTTLSTSSDFEVQTET
jgi:hypothetical protein